MDNGQKDPETSEEAEMKEKRDVYERRREQADGEIKSEPLPMSHRLQGEEYIYAAVAFDSADVLEAFLVREGMQEDYLEIAWDAAWEYGSEKAVQKLSQIDPDGQTLLRQLGASILRRAAYFGREGLAAFLLERGADVDMRSPDGGTALHIASEYGHTGVVKVLLSHGADVNAQTGNGETPLSMALSHCRWDVARVLLEHGAILRHDAMCASACCIYRTVPDRTR